MAKKSINIRAGFDMKAFSTSSQNLTRSLQGTANKMKSIGKSMSMYVTAPLAGMAALSLKAFDEQAKALAQVEAGLKSTGNAVGYTSKQLERMAEDLQQNSLFGDEEILKGATAQLLTFTNIAGVQFERTQQAALDLATRLDGDLKSSSIMLGKALNDPVANLSALSRAGIQFSTDQKQTVKTLVETNRLAEAQTLILNELEKQYGGSAEAAARAGLGPLQQLQMAIGDLSEEFGKIIAEYLIPFADKMKVVIQRFKDTTPATKEMILVIAGLVAAIGPLMLGIAGLTTALAFLAANPIVLTITAIIVAIGALVAAFLYVRDNAQAFADFFYNIWVKIANGFVDAIKFMISGHTKLATIMGLDIGKDVNDWLDSFKLKTRESTKEFKSLKDSFKGVKKSIEKEFGGVAPTVATVSTGGGGGGSAQGPSDKQESRVSALKKEIDSIMEGINEINKDNPIEPVVNMDGLQEQMETIKPTALHVFEQLGQDMGAALSSGLKDLATEGLSQLGSFLGDSLTANTMMDDQLKQTEEHYNRMIQAAQGNADEIARIEKEKAQKVAEIQESFDFDNRAKDFGRGLLDSIGKFMGQFGEAMIAMGVAQVMLNTAIASMNPALAIVGGVALVAAGAAISNLSKKGIGSSTAAGDSPMPRGGNYDFGSQAGEMGYSNMTTTRISGRDLILVQERENSFVR